jgi:hypothetical protein
MKDTLYLLPQKKSYSHIPKVFPKCGANGQERSETTLVSTCDFHENRRKEGNTSLMGGHEITFKLVPRNHITF